MSTSNQNINQNINQTPQQAPQQVQTQPQPQVQPPVTVEIPAEQREMLEILNELVMAAQELSYELATVPSEVVEKTPELKDLIAAARRVVMAVKKFHRFIRERTSRR